MLLDLLIGAAAAFIMSLVACRAQIGVGPIDQPDAARKAHGAPTPTSGGVGVASGFATGLMVLSLGLSQWRNGVSPQGATLVTLTAALSYGFMFVGFIDDARPLGPRLKFIVFAALALAASLYIGVVRVLPFAGATGVELSFAVGLLGTALWVFTLVNCVNFMDGANGLAMGSVAIGLGALACIAITRGAPGGAAIAICGVGALVGFLVWNFPHGRLFAGDSGALFAGALAALCSLLIVARTGLSPFVPPIIFFPLLSDALVTLAWRARRGRSLLDGHSEHLYQIAIRGGWGHTRVTLSYWAASAGCGLLGAWAASQQGSAAPWISLAALAAVFVIVSALVRRAALARGIAEI